MFYIEKTRCEKVIEGGNLDFFGTFLLGEKVQRFKRIYEAKERRAQHVESYFQDVEQRDFQKQRQAIVF